MTDTIKEVSAPYTIRIDDETLGDETIVIHRNGSPIAVVLPYDEYRKLNAPEQAVEANGLEQPKTVEAISDNPAFERERAAYYRLLPELLKTHKGEWVAIVDEQ